MEKSQSMGERLTEMNAINSSLSNLGKVITSLSTKVSWSLDGSNKILSLKSLLLHTVFVKDI